MSTHTCKLISSSLIYKSKVHEADESGASGTYFPLSVLGERLLELEFKIIAHRHIHTAGIQNPASEGRMIILCV